MTTARVFGSFDTICFGGGDWWYHNRAHMDVHMMRRLASRGKVLYVNSIVMTRPKLSSGRKFVGKVVRKAASIFAGLKKTEEGLWIYSPFSLPVQHLNWMRPINEAMIGAQLSYIRRRLGISEPIVWVVCPTACNVALKMPKKRLIYQRTDRFEDYPDVDKDEIETFDRKLRDVSDITIYVNRALFEQEKSQCRKAIFLDHGVDVERFSRALADPFVPPDIAEISGPIVGYFGAIDEHKIDAGFIAALADLLPDVSFVFVGAGNMDCSELAKRKNVKLLGRKPYEEIPHYGKRFNAAMIPWRKNSWTQAANPIKLKEYLALGKPVVCTFASTQLLEYKDVISFADDVETFASSIRKALTDDNAVLAAARKEKVKDASWESKTEAVIRELFSSEAI
ncbi:MAG: glycosyltransferase [Sedimentisphaerales bacterium]|nr:glycosyltransferase [Sedimentisphaerales bacterium]